MIHKTFIHAKQTIMSFQNQLSLFVSFMLIHSICQAKFPHISGEIVISMEHGMLSGDVMISNLPKIKDYSFALNAGLNLEFIRDGEDKFNYSYTIDYNEDRLSESFQYYLPNSDNTGKFLPESLPLKYVGAFPIIKDYSQASDWGDYKGNIAFQKNTLRASEQTAWYPILYDIENDIVLDKYTYDLTIKTEDGNSIYLNGSSPVNKNEYNFKSEIALPLLIYVGQFDFTERERISIVNGKLNAAQEETLSKWTQKIISFYENKLGIPYGSKVTYLGSHPTSKKNGWLFVTYPTIAIIGNDRWSMAGYFDPSTNELIDTSTIGLIAHELGHYYFGSVFVPNSTLFWPFLEGMTEYLSLQVIREVIGENAYQERLDHYRKNIKDLEVVALNKVVKANEINSAYRYNYFPLLITELEKEIGMEKIWTWYKTILSEQPEKSDYDYFKKTLLATGMGQSEFDSFELRYILTDGVVR